MKSTNPYRSARYRWRANQIAAKARRRIERGQQLPAEERHGRVFKPRLAPTLWTIIVRHRDGSRVILHSDEMPHGLTISPSLMGRKIATAMKHYQPAPCRRAKIEP